MSLRRTLLTKKIEAKLAAAREKKADKSMKFDDLDEKKLGKEMSKMKVDEKREAKYSPQAQRSENTKDAAAHLFKNVAQKEIAKNQEIKKDPVGFGFSLYETANVMCSIVDITKDSTIKRDKHHSGGAEKKEPKKTLSRTSLMSQSSTTGPFAQLKENEQKKKKSFDDDDEP